MDQHTIVEQLRALVGAYEAERLGHNGLAQLCIGHDGTVRVTVWSLTDAKLIFGGDTTDEALAKARDGFTRNLATVKDVAAPTDKPRWTPGPWRVDSRHIGLMIESDPHGPRALASISIPIDETDRANARLIAAAPELFEALLHAERQLDESHSYILCDSEHDIPLAAGNELALRGIRAALAKARGE